MSKSRGKLSDILNVHRQLPANNYTGENIKREFKCSGCKRVITTMTELVSHLKVHKSGISVKFYKKQESVTTFDAKLDMLGILSKNTVNLENNTEGYKNHQTKKNSVCNRKKIENTPKDSIKRNQSKKSIMNHENSLKICCKICNKLFKCKGLAAHMKKTHGSIKLGNNIEINSTMDSADINNNVTNELKINRSKKRCNICNKIFKKGGISLHIVKNHKNKKQLKMGKNPKTFCSNKSKHVCIGHEDNVNEQRCTRKSKYHGNSSFIKQSGTNIQFENIYSSTEILAYNVDEEYLLDSKDNSFRNDIPTSYEQGLSDKVEVNNIMYSQEETNIQEAQVDICVLDIYFMDENSTDYISISEDTQVFSNLAQTLNGTVLSQERSKLKKSIEMGEVTNKISSQVKYAKENIYNKLQNENASSSQSIFIKDINDNSIEKVSSVVIVSEFMELQNSDMPLDVYK